MIVLVSDHCLSIYCPFKLHREIKLNEKVRYTQDIDSHVQGHSRSKIQNISHLY